MFWKKDKVPRILKEQLESLLENRVPFLYIYLGKEKPSEPLLESAEIWSPDDFMQKIEEQNVDKSSPIVLVCKNGKLSAKKAQELTKQNYLNAYSLVPGTF